MAVTSDSDIDGEPCTVCGDIQDYDNDRFIFCDGCNIGFHQSCYGLEGEIMNDSDNEEFNCSYCVELNNTNKKITEYKKCQLCGVSKSKLALTTIDGDDRLGKWVHIICAYSFNCKFNDNSCKPPSKIIINRKHIKENKNGKCCICNTSKGCKLQCVHPQCLSKIHPSCARIKMNKNDDSFYFDDIYQDLLFRNPFYFCSIHNIPNNKDNDQNKRKLEAIQTIKKWNKIKKESKDSNNNKNRKRKRESNDDEPMSKRRKLNNEYQEKEEEEEEDESSVFMDAMISTTSSSDGDSDNDGDDEDYDENENEIGGLSEESLQRHNEHIITTSNTLTAASPKSSDSEFSLSLMTSEDSLNYNEINDINDINHNKEDVINSNNNDMMLSASNSTSPPKQSHSTLIDDSSVPLYNRNATRFYKKAKPKLSSYAGSKVANVHDFKYFIDKCYCYKCLNKGDIENRENTENREIRIKQEKIDENSEDIDNDDVGDNIDDDDDDNDKLEWFNDCIWFNRDYTFNDINIDHKKKLTAKFCENINVSINHSSTLNETKQNDDNNINLETYQLNGFESVTMYNYSAINNFEDEDEIPSKPYRTAQIPTKSKKGKKNSSKIGKPGTLFYRKIYRDIMINCGGSIVSMDFCPINKYHNLNAFNYLSVFADIYNKYRMATNPINDNNDKNNKKDDEYKEDKQYLIQIWKLKKRFNKKSKQKSRSTKRGWLKVGRKHKNAIFHYGILHKGGFIWDIKWLPFRINHKTNNHENDDENINIPYQRLGILAVCSEDNFIHIYSLPFVAKDSIIIDIKPVIKLSVTNEKFIRLSWSSNLIYPMLIASTTNGCVSIWDLRLITNRITNIDNNNNNNNNKNNNISIIDEQLSLIPCHSPNEIITGIDWCSDHLKYFITVSGNGCLRLWDVNNLYIPIFTRKLHNFTTDLKWICGMDATLITTESYTPNKKISDNDTGNEDILKQYSNFTRTSTDCATKFASIWPQQYLQSFNDKTIDRDSLSLPTLNREVTRNYSRMGSVIQFPAEKLFTISDKVALSLDILIKCDCNNHGDNIDLTNSINNSNKFVSSDHVNLYVVIGYSSGNVILYQHKLNQLANITKEGNGQILSQLIFHDNDNDNNNHNKCSFIGPFYGINSNIYRNQFNVSRYVWTDKNKHKPIYDPYHLHPTKLALNDNVAIKKVKICPNGNYLDIVSGSISGIIRIQTVQTDL